MDCNYWFDFFELSDEAEHYASKLRIAGLKARLFRPDSPLQVTPFLVDDGTIKKQSEIYSELLNALLNLPNVLFDGDLEAFARVIGFENSAIYDVLRRAGIDDGMMPCRWDVCQKSNSWYAFEANFGGALGGLPVEDLHTIYDELPLPKGHRCDHWKSAGQAIAQCYEKRFGPSDTWQMVVLDDEKQYKESPLTANAAASMMSRYLRQDIPAIAHSDLANTIKSATKPLVAFEMFTLRDIADTTDGSYDIYFTSCANGALKRGVSLQCDLFMSKACLALLHTAAEAQRFEPAICETIRSAIPETRLLTADTLVQVSALPKDHYVIKSALGYGGTAVFCGWEMSQDAWNGLLSRSSDPTGDNGLCVIQRRVDGDPTPSISVMPDGLWVESTAPQVLGIFQIQGEICGGVVRQALADTSIANASRRASVGVIRRTSR
ncbi:MAG: hypothetical protein ABJ327_24570 [Litoreibacter sp.]